MGSSLDGEYSVTRVYANVACYIPFMRFSRGGGRGRSVGGVTRWGGRLSVWKGVMWVGFCKGVFLGYFDDIFLGQVNWCELGSSYGVSLGNFEWTPAG